MRRPTVLEAAAVVFTVAWFVFVIVLIVITRY